MITINATGDTTLHTAGKYCSEDILVKIPAGGGANVETCAVTIKRYGGSSSSYSTAYYTTLVNGNVAAADMELKDKGNTFGYTTFNIICLKNSVLTMYFDVAMGANVNMSSGSILVRNGYDMLVVKLGDADNITIDVGASGGGSN